MRAGLLTEKIHFEKPILKKGDFGGNTMEYRRIITTRCDVLHDGGTRTEENNEMVWTNARTFVIRSYHHIKDDYIIVYNDERFRILNIDVDRELQRTTIKAEKVND